MLGWTAPNGIECARLWLLKRQQREPSNEHYPDRAGYLQAGVSVAWRRRERSGGALRRQLRRGEIERFFDKMPPARVGIEACGASHHWARLLRRLGHEVVLIAPQYVKPYVKRGKNDAIDAEAICEAMSRPGMRFVPIKSTETQAALMLLKTRELFVKQRTMLINATRGHAAEFGVIGAKGPEKMAMR